MRTPKYIGTQSGEWTCVFYGIDYVQPAFRKRPSTITGRKVRSKSAGHRQYYYVFERRTSDDLADKSVRLNAREMLNVSRGKYTVEQIADARTGKKMPKCVENVSYCYC